MPSALRSAAVFALFTAVAVLSTVPGCSQQGEGERCDKSKNGDADCDSGLECTPRSELLEDITDRCCPTPGTENDSRCTPKGTSGTAGSSGTGGSSNNQAGENSGGNGATSGTAAAGSPSSGEGGAATGGAPPAESSGGVGAAGEAAGGIGGND